MGSDCLTQRRLTGTSEAIPAATAAVVMNLGTSDRTAHINLLV